MELMDFLHLPEVHQAIENNDYDRISDLLVKKLSSTNRTEFWNLLYMAGIDPLPHMTYIPEFFQRQGIIKGDFVIPSSITEIQALAFEDSLLTSVSIPGSVKLITLGAFAKCYRLTSINLQPGVEDIGAQAFAHCLNLTELILPDTIHYIGIDAVDTTPKLREITYLGTRAQWKEIWISVQNSDLHLTAIKCKDGQLGWNFQRGDWIEEN